MSHAQIKQRLLRTLPAIPDHDNIRSIALFGSYVRQEENSDSDLDLLIELKQPVGYFALAAMERQLSEAIGLSVDLVTPGSLSKYFRDDVLRSATSLYSA